MFQSLKTLTTLVFSLPTLALAQEAGAPTAPPGGPSPALANLVFVGAMFGILYFLVIRPQSKRQKQHQEFLAKIKRGDEVITSGGLLGRIEGLTEQFVTLEIAPGVRIKILRSQIATTYTPTSSASATSEVKA